jgi:hypothetical protein
MNGEVLQVYLLGPLDELAHQHASQAVVPMFGQDIHALDVPGQPGPFFGPWDTFDHDEPGHSHRRAVQVDQKREMCPAMFRHPVAEVVSEPVRVSVFAPFNRTPYPSQSRQFVRIGEIGLASRGGSWWTGGHVHQLAPSPVCRLAAGAAGRRPRSRTL